MSTDISLTSTVLCSSEKPTVYFLLVEENMFLLIKRRCISCPSFHYNSYGEILTDTKITFVLYFIKVNVIKTV